jgi:amino-acid N-acetyltransferase
MDEFSIDFCEAQPEDLERVQNFLKPFMDGKMLLLRTSTELELLLRHAFVAEHVGKVVGFSAVEVYSRKLAEIQCLAVDAMYQRCGIGRELVKRCVQRANDLKILEVMAISSSEELFRACGFDYSLPNQKRALFIQPHLTTSKANLDHQ